MHLAVAKIEYIFDSELANCFADLWVGQCILKAAAQDLRRRSIETTDVRQHRAPITERVDERGPRPRVAGHHGVLWHMICDMLDDIALVGSQQRSEERRVGKGGRSRAAADPV